MFSLDSSHLHGGRILIVEDDYYVAEELADTIRRSGQVVVGPAPSVSAALALIQGDDPIDGAVLDIRLGDETVFPVAAALRERNIPFVFVTGYDDWFIPQEQEDVPLYRKPLDPENVVRLLFDKPILQEPR